METKERVRTLRDRMGLSQEALARELNVSTATVQSWESGRRTPSGPSLRLIEIYERDTRR